MAGGQCLDIEAEGKELTLAELEQLHAAKTGALIESALVVGGYAANIDPSDPRLGLLKQFGGRIGLAFQVVDDILDVTESSATLGKPAGLTKHSTKTPSQNSWASKPPRCGPTHC